MRARMALAYANITIELREILLSDRPDELYTASSKGTVPVLQLPNGSVIDESFDIMKWALEQTKTDWLDINFEDQLLMIKVNDKDFKPWLNKYKYHQRHPEQAYEYYQNKCVEILSKYEQILSNNLFLFGKKPQISDVAILPLVRQFAHVDLTFFMKMDEVKFKRVVNPGDKLICKLELISPIRRGIIHMKGYCFVGEELASEGEFMAKIIKK